MLIKLLQVSSLLLLIQSQKATESDYTPQSRIIGGTTVKRKAEYPFMVSLQKRHEHLCGGTLITNNKVITAAHCSDSPENWVVKHGLIRLDEADNVSGVTTKQVTKVFRHPNYNPNIEEFDVAIWTLEGKGVEGYQPNIKLISTPLDNYYSRTVMILGWGYTKEKSESGASNTLQEAKITLFSHSKCANFLKNMKSRKYNSAIQLCAGEEDGSRDACQGDSGGPLISKEDNSFILLGVTSYGIGCGRQERPGVYTSLDAMKDFIESNIKEDAKSNPSTQEPTAISPSTSNKPTPTTSSSPKKPTATVSTWFTMGRPNTRPTFNSWPSRPRPIQPWDPQFEVQSIPGQQIYPQTIAVPGAVPTYYYYYYY